MSAVLLGVAGAASGTSRAASEVAGAVPVITTVAGGDGGPAPGTSVTMSACGVSTGAGETYVAGSGVVWRLNPGTGVLVPVAGVGVSNANDSNGVSALTAELKATCGTANDSHGNLVVAASSANEVRVVARQTGSYYGQSMTAGRIYTIAGTGSGGLSGDGGPALKAMLYFPGTVSLDASGNVIFVDGGNNRVRVVAEKTGSFYGQAMKAGDIYTVLARANVQDVLPDRWGNLVGIDYRDTQVWVYAEKTGTYYGQSIPGGTTRTVATDIAPAALALDNAGNIVFSYGRLVELLAASTGSFYGQSMTVGQTYTIAGGGSLTGNGVPALQATVVPTALASESSGALVIGEATDVRVVPQATGSEYGQAMTAGDIYTVAGNDLPYSGDGGPATRAVLPATGDSAVDAQGNILLTSGHVVRVVAEQNGTFYGQQMTKGDIYTIFRPADPGAGPTPYQVSVDTNGNLVLLAIYRDQEHVTIVAEHTGTYYGVPMTAGNAYSIFVEHIADDLAAAWPDHQGNLIITQASPGVVYVLAGHSGVIYGHYLAAGNSRVLAGGGPPPVQSGIPANQGYIKTADDSVVGPAGNLVITDAGDDMIRVVAEQTVTLFGQKMKAGDIYTVAGAGLAAPDKNNIPALSSGLNDPQAATFDSAGNIVIADTYDNQIRVVANRTGSFYGLAMKAGYIYALAGNKRPAFGGDGGPAGKSWLTHPYAVTALPAGGVLVADDGRLRLITS